MQYLFAMLESRKRWFVFPLRKRRFVQAIEKLSCRNFSYELSLWQASLCSQWFYWIGRIGGLLLRQVSRKLATEARVAVSLSLHQSSLR